MIPHHPTELAAASIGHQRWRFFWLCFYTAILASWAGLEWLTVSSLPTVTVAQYGIALCSSTASASPWVLLAMWGLMSAAMMLPSFVPAVRVFGELGSARATDGSSMTALVLGYGAVWLSFSAVAGGLQVMLSRAGTINMFTHRFPPLIAAGFLFVTGAYQFSSAKEACLAKCRHPLVFFMEHWKPGLAPAFSMGARLGVWCVGCCWLLMLLAFLGGAMSLLWMGVATLLMTLEKLPQIGRYLTKPMGAALLVGAVVQLVALSIRGG